MEATRTVVLLFTVLPVWLFAAWISRSYRPWEPCGEHLVVLLLLGMVFTEMSVLRFRKVPFACSYLPGKSNLQAVFWTAVLFLLPVTTVFARWERGALRVPRETDGLVMALCVVQLGLWLWNRAGMRSLELDFEDTEPELLITLGLGAG